MATTTIEVMVEAAFQTPDEPSGLFRLRIEPNATIETLLRKLCKEANTPCKKDYYLSTKKDASLLRTDVLSDVGVEEGTYLIWGREVIGIHKAAGFCNTLVFMAVLAFLIGVVGIITVMIIKYKQPEYVTDYAVVFDAGSSHTSMFIYQWDGAKFNGTAIAEQAGETCNTKGGAISSFTQNPSGAGKSLEQCLKQAVSAIPTAKHSSTPIYLGATAGMRLLRDSNKTISEAILESIRTTLLNQPFLFTKPKQQARIISGDEEGTFSWITSNYLTNSFKVLQHLRDNTKVIPYVISKSVGALDLGGASTQISFIPADPTIIPKGFSKTTKLFGQKYTLYSHSYLCFGVNEAQRRVLAFLITEGAVSGVYEHPCLPEGYQITKTQAEIYDSPCVGGQEAIDAFGSILKPTAGKNASYTFKGQGETDQCSRTVIASLFNYTTPCPYARCSFNGVYQPPIIGPFFAFSSYYYETAFLNLTTPGKNYFTHEEFKIALDRVCTMKWLELKTLPGDQSYLPYYCQEGIYINSLLSQGYRFSDKNWLDIHFVKDLDATEVGWTLGFVLDHSDTYPVHTPKEAISAVAFALLIVLFILFLVVSFGFCVQGLRSRKSLLSRENQMSHYGAI